MHTDTALSCILLNNNSHTCQQSANSHHSTIWEKNSHSNVDLALQTLIIYAPYISFRHKYVLITLIKTRDPDTGKWVVIRWHNSMTCSTMSLFLSLIIIGRHFTQWMSRKFLNFQLVTVNTEIEILDTWIINITGYQEGTQGKWLADFLMVNVWIICAIISRTKQHIRKRKMPIFFA